MNEENQQELLTSDFGLSKETVQCNLEQQGGYYQKRRQPGKQRENLPYAGKRITPAGIILIVIAIVLILVGLYFVTYHITTGIFNYSIAQMRVKDNASAGSDSSEKQSEQVTPSNGNYYQGFSNSIDENTFYSIHFENCDYDDADHNISMHGNYPQVSDDVRNSDYINGYIEDQALYIWNYYNSQAVDSVEQPSDYTWDMESYVTYNDNSVMSVVVQETWTADGSTMMDVTCINIDIENGMILDNSAILNTDDSFAQQFAKRSLAQNGEFEIMNYLTSGDLADYLSDSSYNIIFYTPLGMEVGFRYSTGAEVGWITVTYTDYRDYLKSF